MRQVLERRQPDLQVVVDNIHDPHNASAILRTCDGLGAAVVNFLYTSERPPDISDGVAGFVKKWLDFRWYSDSLDCVSALRDQGLKVYATHLDDGARDFRDIDWTQPSVVAFGNEHRGCSKEFVDLADSAIKIPMMGMAQSFNVSVAAAIVLAEAARQRSEAGMFSPSWEDWHEARLRRWVRREE